MEEPLRWRELVNATDYGLWHLRQRNVEIDSDWAVERVVAQQRERQQSGTSMAQQVKMLREMLGQLGFDVDINLDATPQSREEIKQSVSNRSTERTTFDEIPLYTPRKDAYVFSVGERTYQMFVHSTSSRPNLMYLDEDSLERLFIHYGLELRAAAQLAARIADWRDADSKSRSNSQDGRFQFGDSYFSPPDRPVALWSDLAYLDGMTPDLMHFLRARFSVHGQDQRIDLDFADDAVIAAITDLDLDDVTRGLSHLRNPEEGQENLPLSEIIGTDNARRLLAAVATTRREEDFLLIRVEGDRYAAEVITDHEGTVIERRRL